MLILEGLKMMVMGMGMVFVFLIIMVILMKGMSYVLAPFSQFLAPPAVAPKKKASTIDSAAVAAAVAAFQAAKK